MNKLRVKTIILLFLSVSFSSCYVNKFNIGNGAPEKSVKIKKWNHYLLDGLIPIGTADPQAMAGGAKDYTVTIKHTIPDYIITFLTVGIYSPTITVVKK